MAQSRNPSSFPPGTLVALYLRRSSDIHQEESLETQLRGATEYCDARGWVIVEVFVDGEHTAASRAEFVKRPGLIRLLNHSKRSTFELVVMRDESRLGGDMQRTGLVMQDLADAGVGIVYYITDELVAMEDAVDKFLVAARNFASELEREKISSRVHEHLLQKARDGRPAGGLSFGYAIEDKRYVVNESQAAVVRRIFAERLEGRGFRSIAHGLNRDAVPRPRARSTSSWNPASVRFILTNPRYIGEGRYNRTRKLYRGGTKVLDRRPVAEHVTYACPAIIDRATWDAAQQSLVNNPKFGAVRATRGAAPRYLLTGLSRCGECGGPMSVKKRQRTSPARAYVCGWNRDRGPTVCQNKLAELCEQVDARVLAKLVQAITTQDILVDVVREVRAIHAEQRVAAPAETERLAAEVAQLRREIERLTKAIMSTDAPPAPLVEALSERTKRLRAAELGLEATTTEADTIDQTLAGVELYVRRKLRDLAKQLQDPENAREALVALTGAGKLRFDVVDGRFRVVGSVGIGGLLAPDSDCEDPRTSFDTVRTAAEALRQPFAA